jgi:hypothetical protein
MDESYIWAISLFFIMAEKKIKNELQSDYRLIGFATSMREYKLCFHLNQILEADFRKLKDLTFETSDRSRKMEFSVLSSSGNEQKNDYIVFANKNLGDVLLPEIVQFDYVMKVSGKISAEEISEQLEVIGQLPDMMLCKEIELKKIKNKERLEYEEEKVTQKLMRVKKRLI